MKLLGINLCNSSNNTSLNETWATCNEECEQDWKLQVKQSKFGDETHVRINLGEKNNLISIGFLHFRHDFWFHP
jgi:hypothetical protein